MALIVIGLLAFVLVVFLLVSGKSETPNPHKSKVIILGAALALAMGIVIGFITNWS